MASKKYFIFSVLIITSLILASCGGIPNPAATPEPTVAPVVISDVNIVAEGRIVPRDTAQLSFFTAGQVDEILVEEGSVVKAGDVVARLGNREQYQAAITGAEAELLAGKQALKALYDNNNRARAEALAAVTAANRAVRDALYSLDNFSVRQNQQGMTPQEGVIAMRKLLDEARARFEPYKYFPSTNETRKDLKERLDEAQADFNSAIRRLELETALERAKTNLEEAQKDLDILQAGPDPDDVAVAEARIAAAEANLAAAKANLDNLDLKTTIDGTVVKLDLVVGQDVAPAVPVMTIADFSQMYAETDDLTEIKVVDIEIGQEASVVADALPDIELTGVVEKIDDIFAEKRGDITYTVRVRLNEFDPRLRWGMTVVITFQKK